MYKSTKLLSLILSALLLLTACSDDISSSDAGEAPASVNTYTVAVISPGGSGNSGGERLDRLAEWFAGNLEEAQNGQEGKIALKIEWHDELTEDLSSLARNLDNRDDVVAIIGPTRSENVSAIIDNQKAGSNKLVISPSVSSETVLKKYSTSGLGFDAKRSNFISMLPSATSQLAATLDLVNVNGATGVKLIAPQNDYGKTFVDNFQYMAREKELDYCGISEYANQAELLALVRSLPEVSDTMVICVVNDNSDMAQAINKKVEVENEREVSLENMLFCGRLFDYTIQDSIQAEDALAEGVAVASDPMGDFDDIYEEYYDQYPAEGDAQFYDAFLLTAYALMQQAKDGSPLYTAIRTFTDTKVTSDTIHEAWTAEGIRQVAECIRSGNSIPVLRGASGPLQTHPDFDSAMKSTVYAYWVADRDSLEIYDYAFASENSLSVSWAWQSALLPDFSDPDNYSEDTYAPLADQWAVIVSCGTSWKNYRFQADALNVYQMLKSNGYDDDHIILIMENNLAEDYNNKWKGSVTVELDNSVNLNKDVQVDYITSQISPEFLQQILMGTDSDQNLRTTEGSNVFLYWSGHGSSDRFYWRDTHTTPTFTKDMLATTVRHMSETNRFRKMLIVSEPCMSSNMLSVINEVPGVIAFASATTDEKSEAYRKSPVLDTYLCDRFTTNFVDAVTNKNDISLYDLYAYLVTHTVGSRPQVINYSYFDNLHISKVNEFIGVVEKH